MQPSSGTSQPSRSRTSDPQCSNSHSKQVSQNIPWSIVSKATKRFRIESYSFGLSPRKSCTPAKRRKFQYQNQIEMGLSNLGHQEVEPPPYIKKACTKWWDIWLDNNWKNAPSLGRSSSTVVWQSTPSPPHPVYLPPLWLNKSLFLSPAVGGVGVEGETVMHHWVLWSTATTVSVQTLTTYVFNIIIQEELITEDRLHPIKTLSYLNPTLSYLKWQRRNILCQ